MTKIVKIKKRVATTKIETPTLSILIENNDGIHTHERNGVKFKGKQKDCRLCAEGSDFERAMGAIGT